MKASELNGTHLGQGVLMTDQRTGRAVAGTLTRVDHRTELVPATSVFKSPPVQKISRSWVEVELLGGGAFPLPVDAEVQLNVQA